MDVIRHARPELVVPWKCLGTPSERRGDGGVGKDTGQEGRSLRGISRRAAAVRGSRNRDDIKNVDRWAPEVFGTRQKAAARARSLERQRGAWKRRVAGALIEVHVGERFAISRHGQGWSGAATVQVKAGTAIPWCETRLRPARTVCFRGGATLGMWVEVRAAAAGAVSSSRRPFGGSSICEPGGVFVGLGAVEGLTTSTAHCRWC